MFVGVDLQNGQAWGSAAGDSHVSIESREESAFQYILAGDELANRIEGGHVADKLFGQAGDDRFVVADGFGWSSISMRSLIGRSWTFPP